jgi:DNA invertase Pin-like site-specific DNA recombinase
VVRIRKRYYVSVSTREGPSARERCAIYARNAAGAQHEQSVDQQIAGCRRSAKENGLIVASNCTRFDASKSGTSIVGRPGLQKLLILAGAEPRPFSILLCESVSRLSRNLTDILSIEDSLRLQGIRICFVEAELRSPILDFKSMHVKMCRWMQRTSGTITASRVGTLQPA